MSQDSQDARQFVVFQLSDIACGIPIDSVIEIMRVPEITRGVDPRLAVPGMFDFRGRMVMVVDGRLALGFPANETTDRSRVIVLHHGGEPLGLLVDAVTEVVTLEADRVQATKGNIGVSTIVTSVAHLDEGLMLEVDWAVTLHAALEGGVSDVPAHVRSLAATTGAA